MFQLIEQPTTEQQEQLERITRGCTKLTLSRHAVCVFLAGVLRRIDKRLSLMNETAWTDGVTMGFNPAFVETLSDRQLIGLIAHELLHVAFGHNLRRANRDPELWNRACDCAINPVVRAAGLELPANGLDPAQFDLEPFKSAEYYYREMLSQQQQQPQQPTTEPQKGSGNGNESNDNSNNKSDSDSDSADGCKQSDNSDSNQSDNNSADESDSTSDNSDTGSNSADNSDSAQTDSADGCDSDSNQQAQPTSDSADDKAWQAPTFAGDCGAVIDAPDELQANEQEQATAAARFRAETVGKLPAGLSTETIGALRESKVDYRILLRRIVGNIGKSDYSWRRPSRRGVASGVYLPKLAKPKIRILVTQDTSGSVSREQVERNLGDVKRILNQVAFSEVVVAYHTIHVYHTDRVKPTERFEVPRIRSGGTDHSWLQDLISKERPDVVLCFTDLLSSFDRDSKPRAPVFWLCDGPEWCHEKAPFGTVVDIRE